MRDVSSMVAKQYNAYRYPAPIADLDEHARTPTINAGDPSKLDALFWPEGRPRQNLSILVAGCGTNQAAIIAHANRDCEVVGIDLSESSLGHERYLQEKHSLINLKLFQADLLDVSKLNQKFDLIVCSGVLHHMKNPSDGLKALAAVLHENGAMKIMVYAKAARLGLYLLQDAFRHMGLSQDQDSISVVRDVISSLPAEHFARFYIERTRDSTYDSGIIDAFLHTQDRAYSVSELLEWVESNGLCFQSWVDNGVYFPDNYPSIPLSARTRLEKCALRDVWSSVEGLTHTSSRHLFVACHPSRARRIADIQFYSGPAADLVPVRYPTFHEIVDGERKALIRGRFKFQLTDKAREIFDAIDGRRTTAEIMDRLGYLADDARAAGVALIQALWRQGHVFASSRARLEPGRFSLDEQPTSR
ncbi:class I SAM-dependent methyltransferase [Oceanibaculum nanhaiense]|uniref:class I SAM-dependent methyltransferase n=1 Tax=Oceanibaculum nanhaiense TaxID=1909734 RepID=UPI003F6EB334